MSEVKNLIEGLYDEINRVREIIKEYESPELKDAGVLAAFAMKGSIKRAKHAIATGDTIAMIAACEDLKGYEL